MRVALRWKDPMFPLKIVASFRCVLDYTRRVFDCSLKLSVELVEGLLGGRPLWFSSSRGS